LNFTWESLEAAQNALDNLREFIRISKDDKKIKPEKHETRKLNNYETNFLNAINDDLNTPKAIAIVWQIIKDSRLSDSAKKKLILSFDEVFGLGLAQIKPLKIPQKIKDLAAEREKFRVNKQFIQSDGLRKKIEELGYKIEDTNYGPKITPARH
ncbi:MAG: DALR domain-containing protein, partial [Patescibacteria group bacterium]